MSIKFELAAFELGAVLPYGWGNFPGKWNGTIMGHEFTMIGVFKVVSKWDFSKGKSATTLPSLRWAEREFWWEGDGLGGWTYKGATDKGDLYTTAPASPTWGGFAQGKTEPFMQEWVSRPGFGIASELRTKLLSPSQQLMVQAAENALRLVKTSLSYTQLQTEKSTARGKRGLEIDNDLWFLCAEKIADKKLKMPCAALDRPGMALSGGSGKSGGGYISKSTSPTRRRALQFDLGIVGNGARFTATQILETCNGKPSISKFIIPGKSDEWVKNIPEDYLAYWRSRLNMNNIHDQDNQLESQETINAWVDWCKLMNRVNTSNRVV